MAETQNTDGPPIVNFGGNAEVLEILDRHAGGTIAPSWGAVRLTTTALLPSNRHAATLAGPLCVQWPAATSGSHVTPSLSP